MTLPLDPVAFHVGPLAVHWYGLMYLFAFAAAWILGRIRACRCGWAAADVDDFLTWAMLGVILGGRAGYVLFYDLPAFLGDPVEIVRLWHGGMSFHGGLLGVAAAMAWWAGRHGRHPVDVIDFVAPLVPPGLFFGRIGNFVNGELWGAVTTLPWGMSPVPGAAPRHPSQLYEAGLEGVVLFLCLWTYASVPRDRGRVAGMFMLLYGSFRFLVEFVRMPDAQLGYLAWGWLTMGQILSVPLVLLGGYAVLRGGAPIDRAGKSGKTGS